MNAQCRCAHSVHGSLPIGTRLGNGVVGNWAPLPGATVEDDSGNAEHTLKKCACGCNAYSGTDYSGPIDVDSLDIPVLPLTVEYEDDTDQNDDSEYVSVKATDYAELLRLARLAESSN